MGTLADGDGLFAGLRAGMGVELLRATWLDGRAGKACRPVDAWLSSDEGATCRGAGTELGAILLTAGLGWASI